jgi:hypothetical protein
MAAKERIPALRERRFYFWIASLIALTTLAGFARTYYFRGYFHSPQLRPFLHYHGAVMTGWIVLFLIQTVLISRRRVRLHRALGYAGGVLAALVVVMGCAATILAAAREVRAHSVQVPLRLNILGLELTQMMLFAIFVGIALKMRRQTDLHKRYMLLATLIMLPNPQLRILTFINSNLLYLTIWTVQVFLIVGIDGFRNRRLHPSFLRGALVATCALYAAQFVSITSEWQQIATRLIV